MVKIEKKKRYIKQKLFIHKNVPKKKDALDPPTSMTVSVINETEQMVHQREKKREKSSSDFVVCIALV